MFLRASGLGDAASDAAAASILGTTGTPVDLNTVGTVNQADSNSVTQAVDSNLNWLSFLNAITPVAVSTPNNNVSGSSSTGINWDGVLIGLAAFGVVLMIAPRGRR